MRNLSYKFLIYSLFFLFFISFEVLGYSQNANFLRQMQKPVKLDGISDEPAWQGIEPLRIVMRRPNFGIKPSERTDILMGYDDNYLYLAGRFYDHEPSKIQATATKRDDWKQSLDQIGIIIDTFNDNENAMLFVTTPSGVRIDATVLNDANNAPEANLNRDWNTFWDVEAVRNNDGWFAEIRIPFSSLRFQDKDGQVIMGIIVFRWIARKSEMDIFPAIDPKHGYWGFLKPSQAHEFEFEGIRSQKPLYVAPYLLGGMGQTYKLNDAKTNYLRQDDPNFEPGLDVKYGLTSNLTLDLTVNTDFAQVEADDQQINLTRFSLFFPEKRLFFQERSSNFEFNFDESNRLFYSRRIGIYDGKPVRIYGGGRIVGRVGPWDVGFLNMQTAPVEDISTENFTVLRLRRQIINPSTYIGGIITSRVDKDCGYNTAYGLDGIFRLFGDDYLTLRWAQTFKRGLEHNSASLKPARIFMNWERRTIEGLGYNLSYSRAGAAYDPGMGYERRDDFTWINSRVLYGWIPGDKSSLKSHQILTEGLMFFRNHDGSTESADFGMGYEFESKYGYNGSVLTKIYHEDLQKSFNFSHDTNVPTGNYTFFGMEGKFSTCRGRLYSIGTSLEVGQFYDGWRVTMGLTPSWNISSNVEVSGFYQINKLSFEKRNQNLLAHVGRFKTLVRLNFKFSISSFIQYNSIINAVITNIRIRYNPSEGNDLYLVYDEGYNTDRYRTDPILPVTSNRALFMKYTYTFKL